MRNIRQVEYDLNVKFAQTFSRMLEGSARDRAQLEAAYKIEPGGLSAWVKTRVNQVLAKAKSLQSQYGDLIRVEQLIAKRKQEHQP